MLTMLQIKDVLRAIRHGRDQVRGNQIMRRPLELASTVLVAVSLSVGAVSAGECTDCAEIKSKSGGILAGLFCRGNCEDSGERRPLFGCLADLKCWLRQKEYDKYLERHHRHPHFHYPISSPFCSPTHGYYETCWRKMPGSIEHCYPNCNHQEHGVTSPVDSEAEILPTIPAQPPAQLEGVPAPMPEVIQAPSVNQRAPEKAPVATTQSGQWKATAMPTASRPLTPVKPVASVKSEAPVGAQSNVLATRSPKAAVATDVEWKPTAIRLIDGVSIDSDLPDDPRLELTPISIE